MSERTGGENPSENQPPTEEQIAALMRHIERIEKKRKIMLAGYLAALVLLVGGQIGAFVVYAHTPPGTFVGWVFLVPFALVGSVLWLFGKWAQSIKRESPAAPKKP